MLDLVINDFSTKLEKANIITVRAEEFSEVLFKFINESNKTLTEYIQKEENRISKMVGDIISDNNHKITQNYYDYYDNNLIKKIDIDINSQQLVIKCDDYEILSVDTTLNYISKELYSKIAYLFVTYKPNDPENYIHFFNSYDHLIDVEKCDDSYKYNISTLYGLKDNISIGYDRTNFCDIKIWGVHRYCQAYKNGDMDENIQQLKELFEGYASNNKKNNLLRKKKLYSKTPFLYGKMFQVCKCLLCDKVVRLTNINSYEDLEEQLESYFCGCVNRCTFKNAIETINKHSKIILNASTYSANELNSKFHNKSISGECKDCKCVAEYKLYSGHFEGTDNTINCIVCENDISNIGIINSILESNKNINYKEIIRELIKAKKAKIQKIHKISNIRKDNKRYIYILDFELNGLKFGKYGISYVPEKRLENLSANANGMVKLKRYWIFEMTNYHVKMLESELKSIQSCFVSKDLFCDGYTETFDINDINIVQKIKSNIERYFKDNNFNHDITTLLEYK